jgi:hypothetical protein
MAARNPVLVSDIPGDIRSRKAANIGRGAKVSDMHGKPLNAMARDACGISACAAFRSGNRFNRLPLSPPSASARVQFKRATARWLRRWDEIAPKRGARRRTNPTLSASLRSRLRRELRLGQPFGLAVQASVPFTRAKSVSPKRRRREGGLSILSSNKLWAKYEEFAYPPPRFR